MISLRPYQQEAAATLATTKRGICQAPAGSGKTLIAAGAIDRWLGDSTGLSVLWLCNTIEQCQQAEAACANFCLRDRLGILKVACYQSGEQAKDYDLFIGDEVHHIASPEFRKCLDGYNGPRWGFSATPDRGDDLKDDVYELIGPIVYEVPREELLEAGNLAPAKVYFLTPNEPDEMETLIEEEAKVGAERMKGAVNSVAVKMQNKSVEQVTRLIGKETMQKALLRCEAWGFDIEAPYSRLLGAARGMGSEESMEEVRGWIRDAAKKEILSRARWHSCQGTGITHNERRNAAIIDAADKHADDSVLVLVGSIEHGELLQERIPGSLVFHSKMKGRKEAIEAFRLGFIKCAIATSLADEGLDVPRANVLILAAAGRSAAKAEQRTGRVLRSWSDKVHGTIYDFWDWHVELLRNQSRARAKVYCDLKYEFVGAERVLPVVLKSLGIKIHPAIGMGRKKNLSGDEKANRVSPSKGKDLAEKSVTGAKVPSATAMLEPPSEHRSPARDGSSPTQLSGTVKERESSGMLPVKDEPPTAAQNNLPVPVLAEAAATEKVGKVNESGESRESTRISMMSEPGVNTSADSRGGQKISQQTGCINPTPQLSSAPNEPPVDTHNDDIIQTSPDGVQQPPESIQAADNFVAVSSSAPTDEPDRTHARLSPSTLKGKAICPGFISDPKGDKTAADRGTLGHKAVEKENPDLCGDDEQLRGAVVSTLKYREKVLAKARKTAAFLTRKEVRLDYLTQWGFTDEVLIGGPTAWGLDYKFTWEWYPADSPQFWAYSIGVWDKYPEVVTIEWHVIHPFLGKVDVEKFSRQEHYSKFTQNIMGIMALADRNDPATYRITDQCRYCGFAGKCSKLADLGIQIGRKYADDIEIPQGINFHGSQITDPKVMATLLMLSPIVKKAAEGWTKAGLEMYDNGTDVPGYKLVTKSGERKVVSAKAAYEIVKREFIPALTMEAYLEHCDVSATGLDTLVSDATPKGSKGKPGKEHAVKLLRAHLEDADALSLGGGSRYLMKIKTQE